MARAEQRLRIKPGQRTGGLLAALDIGCSKIACLIASRDLAGPNGYRLCGGGRQQSRGFTGGTITDMVGLERAIRLAVEDAERQAGERIDKVILGVTGPKVACQLVMASIDIGGREIKLRDVNRVQTAALAKARTKGLEILSLHTVAYLVDDQENVRNACGLYADRLGVLLSVVTAPGSMIRNLVECVGRAHLGVEQLVPSAIAGGMGTLIDDERENGAICIDMGSGVTSVSVFLNGAPAWLGLVPAGGQHVTGDIAQGIGTTFAAAERMKTVYATANTDGPGLAERIEAPRLGDDGRLKTNRMAKGDLAKIVAPRIEEIFELVNQRLQGSSLATGLPRRIVLTGGASQLSGVRDVAQRVFDRPVRLGRPVSAEILGEILGTPAFSTASGLLAYDLAGYADATRAGVARSVYAGGVGEGSRVNKALHWLRENF